MNTLAAPSIRVSATPMPVCSPYRRKTTQRAPRKRSALLLFSKLRAESVALAACGGGNGPRGPVDNSMGCRRWWGDEPSNNHGGAISMLPGGMAVLLPSLAVAGALQAGPACAAASSFLSEGMEALAGELQAAATDNTSLFSTLPADYNLHAFTEEEKELVCPKQYRVREIVYVGH